MYDLEKYNVDGASWQSQAVACCLKARIGELQDCDPGVVVEIGRYENCHEQGYVIHVWSLATSLNVSYCFFTDCEDDIICCVKFTSLCADTPSNSEIWAGRTDAYGRRLRETNEYGVDHYEDSRDLHKMATWIFENIRGEIMKKHTFATIL